MAKKKLDAGHAKEITYTSKQNHEQAYKGKRKGKVLTYKEDGGSMASGGEIKVGDKVKVVSNYGSGINSVSKGQRGQVEAVDKSDDKTAHIIGSNGFQFWTPSSNLEIIDSYEDGGSMARGGEVEASVKDTKEHIGFDDAEWNKLAEWEKRDYRLTTESDRKVGEAARLGSKAKKSGWFSGELSFLNW
tara:strand:- start:1234 stop:1797 length:564 start_codon:yes stop_codon:yes gene_type:complete